MKPPFGSSGKLYDKQNSQRTDTPHCDMTSDSRDLRLVSLTCTFIRRPTATDSCPSHAQQVIVALLAWTAISAGTAYCAVVYLGAIQWLLAFVARRLLRRVHVQQPPETEESVAWSQESSVPQPDLDVRATPTGKL